MSSGGSPVTMKRKGFLGIQAHASILCLFPSLAECQAVKEERVAHSNDLEVPTLPMHNWVNLCEHFCSLCLVVKRKSLPTLWCLSSAVTHN